MTITILVGVIVLVEFWRVYTFYKKPTKKEYFEKRLVEVIRTQWDLEFKVYKMREVREDVRREHSDTKSRIVSLEKRVEDFPKEGNVDEKKRLDDDIVRFNESVKRYEAQMKQIDIETEGSKPTNEYPDGVTGIVQQLESLKEVEQMLKGWLRNI